MEIIYLSKAQEDLEFWTKSGNKTLLKKIAQLKEATIKKPLKGIEKPEALKYELAGKWSGRIFYHIDLNIP